MTLPRHGLSIVLAVLATAALSAPAAAQPSPRALIVFHPGGLLDDSRTVFERLAARGDLSLGWLGATQGAYSVRQTLLDFTQGHRLSRSGYAPESIASLRLDPRRRFIAGWRRAVRRARSAPADIVPGLLAGSVPGGAAYAGVGTAATHVEALVAADTRGRVASVSLGLGGDVVERARRLLERHRLVVVNLAPGPDADRALDELRTGRAERDLLLVIRTPPRSRSPQLLPTGVAGLEPERPAGLIRSATTRRDGLVASHDVLPTVLGHLGVPVPGVVRGRPIVVAGERDVAYLRRLERRLRVVYPRRFPSLFAVGAAVLLVGLIGGRRGKRIAGLAFLWVPTVSLACAAIEPARAVEILLMATASVGLGGMTDRFVRWPRAPAVPAAAGILAYTIDLIAGSPLIVRSLLGPNPRFGARWYGIGNELEAGLPVLLLVGVAAAAGAVPRSRRLAAAFGSAMLGLAAVVGAGRLGADVGGVITIGAGGAAAVVLALPGRLTRRRIALACLAPVMAVLGLAAVDLLTGGDSHFVATVLGAEDSAALADVAERRTRLALDSFMRGLMPLATALAVAAVVVGFRRREELLRHVSDRPAWGAALGGGAVGGVVGSLANDSGPVLLVIGCVVLGAAAVYVKGGAPASAR